MTWKDLKEMLVIVGIFLVMFAALTLPFIF